MTQRVVSRALAPALLVAGALLAGVTLAMRPAHAGAAIVALCTLAAMALVLWRAERGATGVPGRRRVRDGVALAAGIIAFALAIRLSDAFGVHPPRSLALRVTMLATAVFLIATGNALPKVLVPASRFGDVARVDACRRVAGWTGVLTGVALALVWLVLPEDAAMVASLGLFAVAALVLARPLGFGRGRGEPA